MPSTAFTARLIAALPPNRKIVAVCERKLSARKAVLIEPFAGAGAGNAYPLALHKAALAFLACLGKAGAACTCQVGFWAAGSRRSSCTKVMKFHEVGRTACPYFCTGQLHLRLLRQEMRLSLQPPARWVQLAALILQLREQSSNATVTWLWVKAGNFSEHPNPH